MTGIRANRRGGHRRRSANAASSSARTSRASSLARTERPRLRHGGPHPGRHRPARRRARGSRPMTTLGDPPTPSARPPDRAEADAQAVPPGALGRADHLRAVRARAPAAILPPATEPAITRGRRQPGRRAARRRSAASGRPRSRSSARSTSLRHYDRLSQETLGADLNVDVGPGHLHDEVLAEGQRPAGPEPEARRPPPAPGPGDRPGRPRDHVAPGAVPRRDLGHGPRLLQPGAGLRRDLGQRLDDPRLPRSPRRGSTPGAPRRSHHDDLQPPLERRLREGRRLPGHHALPGRGRLPGPRRAAGGGLGADRGAPHHEPRGHRASSTRGSRSSSGSSTRPAAWPRTTRRTRTGSSASPGPATPASTSATSTCTRRSRPRTAAGGRPPGPAA